MANSKPAADFTIVVQRSSVSTVSLPAVLVSAVARACADCAPAKWRGSWEIGCALTGDQAIRRLNRDYRGKDKTTDVLSFEGDHQIGDDERRALGDIIISLPQAKRQAASFGHSVRAEVVRLMVHGIAHLIGYDHELGPRQARTMFAYERRVLDQLPVKLAVEHAIE